MPYEGEFAGYRPLQRIVGTERVQQLLKRSRTLPPPSPSSRPAPKSLPDATCTLPDFVVAIDGSYQEVRVRNGYPGAHVGYCTVASVLVNLAEIDRLDESRPVDPKAFRRTEEASSIDAALPCSNVVTRNNQSAQASFREALFEVFHDVCIDADDRIPLLDTFHALLCLKPQGHGDRCPYRQDGCEQDVRIGPGVASCPCASRRPIYSTDALRIHEGFRSDDTNGEALGEVMQVWERILLVHLLRGIEQHGWLPHMAKLAFIVDGPLAVFGHPAWLSAAISAELKRLNGVAEQASGRQLLILGIEKSGAFVTHFDDVDQTETGDVSYFPSRSYMLPSDTYIKQRIVYSDSPKRYGLDTYFGRKFLYKTKSGARIVANMPFLNENQDTLDTDDITAYPRFIDACTLLDQLVSSRFRNAVSPIVSAHAQAAIPLHLGAKVLQQLARALMPTE